MYTYEPGLLLGTPWGRVHVALLLAGAFLLGAAVVGMYVLAGWVTYRTRLSRHGRELRRTRGELDALKKGQIKEVPGDSRQGGAVMSGCRGTGAGGGKNGGWRETGRAFAPCFPLPASRPLGTLNPEPGTLQAGGAA